MTKAAHRPKRIAVLARTEIRPRANRGAVAAFALVVILAACAQGGRSSPDPMIDGYSIGPERTAGSPEAGHALEAAARRLLGIEYPGLGFADSFEFHAAGLLPDGSRQAGVEGPATYLVVVRAGGVRHALVIACDPGTLPTLEECG